MGTSRPPASQLDPCPYCAPLQECATNTTLLFSAGPGAAAHGPRKQVLIMDEVDGMSGESVVAVGRGGWWLAGARWLVELLAMCRLVGNGRVLGLQAWAI